MFSTQHGQAVGQPERAGQKGALPTAESVHITGVDGAVPEDEPAVDQLALDSLDGAPHPGIVGREEADQRDHQQTGVELVGPVVLGERPDRGVEPLVADLVMDLLADLLPPVDRTFPTVFLRRLDGTVDGHPCHDLRVGEVAAGTPNLPDAVIRLAPPVLQKVHQRELELPTGTPRIVGRFRLVEGRHDLAVHIQLELPGGGIADADRSRTLVPGQPVHLPFVEPAFTCCAVHDLHLRRIPGRGPQQPVPPGHGLLVEATPHEGLEGQGGVPQPAEPVVPVATPTQRLG